MIKVENLTKIYQAKNNMQVKALDNLSFVLPDSGLVFVIGKSANGLTSWKTADGKTLKSLESEQTAD